MGILDEAIREHLELKRRRGATESELKELEDEAFGPPRRPEKSALESAEVPPTAGEPAQLLEEEPPLEEGPVEEFEEEPVLEEEEALPAMEAAEAGFEGDYEPQAAGPNGHPEQAEPDLTELDLELQEKEFEAEEAEEPPEAAAEPGVEALETREHPMDELLEEPPADEAEVEYAEPAEEAAEEGPPAEEEPPAELAEEEPPAELAEEEPPAELAEEEGGEDEDVLEETPEFLQDRPEDDELWFEQGEPKDFDF